MFNTIFDPYFLTFIGRISLAMLLGILLGLERLYAHKAVGMRTYALISVASAMFVSVSLFIGNTLALKFASAFNPAFMAAYIISGIGFLGTGLIIFNQREGHVENLTTAAGMWICAGVGMAVGFGMYRESIFVTILAFFVLGVLTFVERSIRLRIYPDPAFEKMEEKIEKRFRRKKAAPSE